MPKLPQISGDTLVRALKRDRWQEVSQKGSHLKLMKDDVPYHKIIIIIPMHKTIKKGTLHGILKDAQVSVEKLRNLL